MYPRGTYKGGMGDIPFLDPIMGLDTIQAVNSYNLYATALTASTLVQNYNAQGTPTNTSTPTTTSQTFSPGSWAMKNQGTLALVALGIVALAALKR